MRTNLLLGGETEIPDNRYPSTPDRDGSTGYPYSTPYPPHRPPRVDPRNPLVLDDEFVVPVGARAEMRCQIHGNIIDP